MTLGPSLSAQPGWKLGELSESLGRLRLQSALYGVAVQIEDRAICFEHLDHDPPVKNCSCGFIASTRPEPLIVRAQPPYSELWEVELSGRILPERDAFRGEWQRVRRLHLNPLCYECGQAAAVVSVTPFDTGSTRPVPGRPLLSSCHACAGRPAWSPDEVAGELNVEVRWARPEYVVILEGLTTLH